MIGMKATTQDTTDRVAKAAERASRGNVRAGAFLVMHDAKKSIVKAPAPTVTAATAKTKRDSKGRFLKGSGKRKKRKGRRQPSPAGTPPFTDRGLLPRSIGYAVEGDSAVIGTQYSMIGLGGKPHEDGGEFKGDDFPERAFMWPALQRKASIFGNSFQGSIGGGLVGSIGA
jgi:hypothetical protein